MTIPKHNAPVPIRQWFFLFGLGLILAGQLLLAKGHAYIYSQEPLDFAHWSLLLGTALLIPYVARFPRSLPGLLGGALTLIGIVCINGMCVLDFIWWSAPSDEWRSEFAAHVSGVPSIWKPFISIGPSSKIFNLGLLLLSFSFWSKSKVGIALVLLANLV